MGENEVAHNEKLEFAFIYRPGVNDLYLPLNTRVGVNILISLFLLTCKGIYAARYDYYKYLYIYVKY